MMMDQLCVNQLRQETAILQVTGSSSQSAAAPLGFSLTISSAAKTLVLKKSSSSLVSLRQTESSCLQRMRRKRRRVVRSGPMATYLTLRLERSSMTKRQRASPSGCSTLSTRCLFMRLDIARRSRSSSSFSRLSRWRSESSRQSNCASWVLKVEPPWWCTRSSSPTRSSSRSRTNALNTSSSPSNRASSSLATFACTFSITSLSAPAEKRLQGMALTILGSSKCGRRATIRPFSKSMWQSSSGPQCTVSSRQLSLGVNVSILRRQKSSMDWAESPLGRVRCSRTTEQSRKPSLCLSTTGEVSSSESSPHSSLRVLLRNLSLLRQSRQSSRSRSRANPPTTQMRSSTVNSVLYFSDCCRPAPLNSQRSCMGSSRRVTRSVMLAREPSQRMQLLGRFSRECRTGELESSSRRSSSRCSEARSSSLGMRKLPMLQLLAFSVRSAVQTRYSRPPATICSSGDQQCGTQMRSRMVRSHPNRQCRRWSVLNYRTRISSSSTDSTSRSPARSSLPSPTTQSFTASLKRSSLSPCPPTRNRPTAPTASGPLSRVTRAFLDSMRVILRPSSSLLTLQPSRENREWKLVKARPQPPLRRMDPPSSAVRELFSTRQCIFGLSRLLRLLLRSRRLAAACTVKLSSPTTARPTSDAPVQQSSRESNTPPRMQKRLSLLPKSRPTQPLRGTMGIPELGAQGMRSTMQRRSLALQERRSMSWTWGGWQGRPSRRRRISCSTSQRCDQKRQSLSLAKQWLQLTLRRSPSSAMSSNSASSRITARFIFTKLPRSMMSPCRITCLSSANRQFTMKMRVFLSSVITCEQRYSRISSPSPSARQNRQERSRPPRSSSSPVYTRRQWQLYRFYSSNRSRRTPSHSRSAASLSISPCTISSSTSTSARTARSRPATSLSACARTRSSSSSGSSPVRSSSASQSNSSSAASASPTFRLHHSFSLRFCSTSLCANSVKRRSTAPAVSPAFSTCAYWGSWARRWRQARREPRAQRASGAFWRRLRREAAPEEILTN